MNFLETADTGSITVAGETLWSADDARTQSESLEELEHEVREAQAEALDQVASESDDSDI